MPELKKFQSQITFIYLPEIQPAIDFFEGILGLEMMDDQGWAKIYRAAGDSYIGAVSGEKAFKKHQEDSAVLITFCVDDVPAWYEYLKSKGVKILREMQDRPDNQVRCFFIEGPGGYSFEIQEFMNPEKAKIFHK
jgi:predicted enzyme related to lactoylglutathione lyase